MTLESQLVNYLALAAWSRRVECVVLSAPTLRTFYGLERLPDARVRSLVSSAKPLFPHVQRTYVQPESNSDVAVYLSRCPLPPAVFSVGPMSPSTRIRLLETSLPTVELVLPMRQDLRAIMERTGTGRTVFTSRVTNAKPGDGRRVAPVTKK